MTDSKQQIWVLFRSKNDPTDLFVHPDLPGKIAADMEAKGTNATDLANEILSAHFHVPYEPRRRKDQWDASKGYINFRVSRELDRAIRVEAAGRAVRPMELCRMLISAHYGLPLPPRKKRSRVRTPRVAPKTA